MSPRARDQTTAPNRLRYFRKQRNLSQTQLALAAKVSPATISHIEKHQAFPTLVVCEKIADTLQVTVRAIWPEIPQPQLDIISK